MGVARSHFEFVTLVNYCDSIFVNESAANHLMVHSHEKITGGEITLGVEHREHSWGTHTDAILTDSLTDAK